MLIFFSITFFLILAWIGLGSLLLKVLKCDLILTSPMEKAITGLSFMAMLTMLFHFFMPVSRWLNLLWLSIGVGYWAWFHPDKKRFLISLIIISFCATLVFRTSAENFDAGLYYVPTLMWLDLEPITLGLVNLHGRLAFNSIWHLIAASSQLPGLDWAGAFSINAALWSCFFLDLYFFKPFKEMPFTWQFWIAVVLLIAPGMSEAYRWGSPAHDLPCAVVALFALARTFDQDQKHWLLPSLMASLIKLLALPILILEIIRKRKFLFRSPLFWMSVSILLLWLTRNWLLSGCFIYPASFTCTYSVPWTPPMEVVEKAAAFVKLRALSPLGVANGGWSYWTNQFISSKLGLFTLFITLLLPFTFSVWRKHKYPVLIIFSLILTWLVGGPYPRMGYLSLAAMTSFILWCCYAKFPRFQISGIPILGLAFSIWVFNWPWHDVLKAQEWPRIPAVKSVVEKNIQGESFYRPDGHIKCWNLPLPCVAHFNPYIVKNKIGIWMMYLDSSKTGNVP